MIEAIRAGLAELADPEKAPDMQAYMKSAMPFLGVQKPARDALAREVFGHVASGDIRIEINQRYWLTEAARAHRELESRATTGSSIFVI